MRNVDCQLRANATARWIVNCHGFHSDNWERELLCNRYRRICQIHLYLRLARLEKAV
jgi:hypothetical protein